MFISRLFAVALCAVPIAPLAAHEYWIEPESYQVAPGASIRAAFKNGQEFKGSSLSYLDRSSLRFDWMMDGTVTPVGARSGDSPALQMEAPDKEGLFIVAYETTSSTLKYAKWEKFATFIAHKDFANAEADHTAAGWPRDGFRETYSRHVKALIGIGKSAGDDRAFGLKTEFVALTNPYVESFDGNMSVQLLFDQAPRADAQVEVFDRAPDGTVDITLHRTDANGRAVIPVLPGHDYLFDAVALRPASNPQNDPNAAVWETFWAALTFGVPQ